MEDSQIVELYWQRSEQAIVETKNKYESILYSVAKNILNMHEDREECINDTYFKAWNSMPKARPKYLCAFLCRITKNKAIDKYKYITADKRNKNMEVSLYELQEVLLGTDYEFAEKELMTAINTFLGKQQKMNRILFIRRYFFYDSIDDIGKRYHLTSNTVKKRLQRTREHLKDYLKKEGYYIGL